MKMVKLEMKNLIIKSIAILFVVTLSIGTINPSPSTAYTYSKPTSKTKGVIERTCYDVTKKNKVKTKCDKDSESKWYPEHYYLHPETKVDLQIAKVKTFSKLMTILIKANQTMIWTKMFKPNNEMRKYKRFQNLPLNTNLLCTKKDPYRWPDYVYMKQYKQAYDKIKKNKKVSKTFTIKYPRMVKGYGENEDNDHSYYKCSVSSMKITIKYTKKSLLISKKIYDIYSPEKGETVPHWHVADYTKFIKIGKWKK
jgi:hypothetical protein